MKKKLIGLISLFFIAEIVCIIGYNVQSALRPYVLCNMNDPVCNNVEWMNAYISAENEKIFAWVYAFFNIGYIFLILLTILISFNYYQKRKRDSAFPLETQGMAQ